MTFSILGLVAAALLSSPVLEDGPEQDQKPKKVAAYTFMIPGFG